MLCGSQHAVASFPSGMQVGQGSYGTGAALSFLGLCSPLHGCLGAVCLVCFGTCVFACLSSSLSNRGISEALAVLAVSLSLLKPSSSSPRRAKIHRTLCSSRRMVGSRSGWKCCWNGQQWVVPQFFSGVFLGTME